MSRTDRTAIIIGRTTRGVDGLRRFDSRLAVATFLLRVARITLTPYTRDEPMAEYTYSKDLGDVSFDEAVERVTEALGEEGFGVLTEIDVRATLKKKLDEDFRDYKILGACNPQLAHQGLEAEPELGALLPCNVVVQRREDGGGIRVSLLKPAAMFEVVDNDAVQPVADDADARLQRVLEAL